MINPCIQKIGLFALGLVFCIGLQSRPVLAQPAAPSAPKPDVESVLTSKKVTLSADKKEVLVDSKDLQPGEILEYRVTYTNKGKEPVNNVMLNLPIPVELEYVGGSAKPAAGLLATVGDGKFAPIPLKRKVKLPNGKDAEQDVPLAEYRSLRWNAGEMAPGKILVVSARVRLSIATPAAPAAPAAGSPPPATPQGGQK